MFGGKVEIMTKKADILLLPCLKNGRYLVRIGAWTVQGGNSELVYPERDKCLVIPAKRHLLTEEIEGHPCAVQVLRHKAQWLFKEQQEPMQVGDSIYAAIPQGLNVRKWGLNPVLDIILGDGSGPTITVGISTQVTYVFVRKHDRFDTMLSD